MTYCSFLSLVGFILSLISIIIIFYPHVRIRINNYRAKREWMGGKLKKFSSIEELMKDLKD